MQIDERLLEWATPRQREYIEAVEKYGSARAAAKALGVNKGTVSESIAGLKVRAAKMGYSPEHDMTRTVPAGFSVRGVSTYYDSEGNARGQWVKSKADDDAREAAVRAWVEALAQDVPPLPPIAAPIAYDDDLLTLIPLGDPHFGLLVWKDECGENFDLAEAERITFAAVDKLCARTPPSKRAVLLNLGDYFHADDGSNRTPRSGNTLDVDGRFQKIATVGVRALERCIIRLLEKHGEVVVRNNRGNHDPHQAIMLSICLKARFHDNPRVIVDTSPSSFWYYRHGKTLIGSTHGDGAKLVDLPLIMANDAAVDWAAAVWRVWHCGHFHHDQVKELVGCTVETHRTLAPNDAWHMHAGYRSKRDVKAIVYHIEEGEIQRIRCAAETVRAPDAEMAA